jgi:hypothetical protein
MIMINTRQQFNSEFFMEIFMLGVWLIWKQRNNTIFNRDRATFQGWKRGFIDEALLQACRFLGWQMKLDFQSFTAGSD